LEPSHGTPGAAQEKESSVARERESESPREVATKSESSAWKESGRLPRTRR
jgi:hypothetical protein